MAAPRLPNFWENIMYSLIKNSFRLITMIFYRIRCHDTHWMPKNPSGLICSNHQSNLDPIVVGIACEPDIHYLAKESLFEKFPLKYLRDSLHCIPINREMGIGGMKKTIHRLKKNRAVLMFPEGTRSLTGEMQPFKSGFLTLARRTNSDLYPVGVDGTYDAYPPKATFPKPGHVHVVFGEPIPFEQYQDMSDEEVVQLLESRVRECVNKAKQKREHHISLNIRNRQPQWRLSTPVEQPDKA